MTNFVKLEFENSDIKMAAPLINVTITDENKQEVIDKISAELSALINSATSNGMNSFCYIPVLINDDIIRKEE